MRRTYKKILCAALSILLAVPFSSVPVMADMQEMMEEPEAASNEEVSESGDGSQQEDYDGNQMGTSDNEFIEILNDEPCEDPDDRTEEPPGDQLVEIPDEEMAVIPDGSGFGTPADLLPSSHALDPEDTKIPEGWKEPDENNRISPVYEFYEILYVSDEDEDLTFKNQIDFEDEIFTYHVLPKVPDPESWGPIQYFMFSFSIADRLEVLNWKVTDINSGEDLTQHFEVDYPDENDRNWFFIFTEDTKDEEFLHRDMDLSLDVRIREEYRNGETKRFYNEVAMYCGLEGEDYYGYPLRIEIYSNEVTSVYRKYKDFISVVIEQHIDNTYGPFGPAVFLYRLTGSNGREYIVPLTIEEGENTGRTVAKVDFDYENDVFFYKVERLSGYRYTPMGVHGGSDNVSAEGDFAVAEFSWLGNYEKAEVIFEDSLSRYDRFSHTDLSVNRLRRREFEEAV